MDTEFVRGAHACSSYLRQRALSLEAEAAERDLKIDRWHGPLQREMLVEIRILKEKAATMRLQADYIDKFIAGA